MRLEAVLLAMAALLSLPPTYAEETPATGRLEVVAAVVGADLTIRPVPKHRLRVLADPLGEGPAVGLELATGFDGMLAVELIPGPYRLLSIEPIPWEGTQLSWNVAFEISAGVSTRVELSTDNAVRTRSRPGQATDEAKVFEAARAAVFVVETDSGHGSGFLVDKSGLVLTNHHVVSQARYLAVKTDVSRKYPAQLLALDGEHDLAVVRVNPGLVDAVQPLTLQFWAPDEERVTVGEKVVAIGSPLTQESVMTTGVVSRVQPDVIISDVNINQGNSGGPLLDLESEVLGVNTFGIEGDFGPGMSGIVRIHLAQKVLEDARLKAATLPPPLSGPLPVVSGIQFPSNALKEMLVMDPDIEAYHVEAGKLDVRFGTPPLFHSISKQGELRAAEQQKIRRKGSESTYNPKDDFYSWRQHSGIGGGRDYDAVVSVYAIPELKMTGASKAGLFFGALAGIVTPIRYRFKTDFREMRLFKDGTEVQPILPGRSCQAVAMRNGLAAIEDIGCYGIYQYRPEEFRPGSVMLLKVFNEDAPAEPTVLELDRSLVCRIYKDFLPYYKAAYGPETPSETCSLDDTLPPPRKPGLDGGD